MSLLLLSTLGLADRPSLDASAGSAVCAAAGCCCAASCVLLPAAKALAEALSCGCVRGWSCLDE